MSGISRPVGPASNRPSPRPARRAEPESPSPRDEVWLSSAEVSRRLKIPVKTLAAWASAGRGPRYARMGRYRRYRVTDLEVWEQAQVDGGRGSTAVAPPPY
ncbi:helix-turn-helix domain-containing protein [Nocardia takedensis]